jgi:hypothetical protein
MDDSLNEANKRIFVLENALYMLIHAITTGLDYLPDAVTEIVVSAEDVLRRRDDPKS